MKQRPPVRIGLAILDPVTPFAQAVRRQMEPGRIFPDAQSAPDHRFDMHRPERLNGLTALVMRRPFAPALTPLSPHFGVQFALDLQGFCVHENGNPTLESVIGNTILTAIPTPRQPAPLPCFHTRYAEALARRVHRPVRTPRLVLEMFRYHRRFSHARKNPIWNGITPPYRCVRTGRLPMNWIALLRSLSWTIACQVGGRVRQGGATIGWQDKSGSPAAIQAIDMACLSPCRMVGSRAAPRQKANVFNDVYGTVAGFRPFGYLRQHRASRLEICILEWYIVS